MRFHGPTIALATGLLTALALTTGAGARPSTHEEPAAPVKAAGAANRPLETAIMDTRSFVGADSKLAYDRARRAGAGFLRVLMSWAHVAPSQKPSTFAPRNPADPRYRWAGIDQQVKTAVTAGFTPILYVQNAPTWSQRCSKGPGSCRPDPGALDDFMTAAARRYSGKTRGLPRVRYWQIWNEPNLDWFLTPQADASGRPVSPEIYRELVNAAYRAIHGVRDDNVVIAGGTMPFGRDDNVVAVPPLRFLRAMLCLSADARPTAVCSTQARFDVWAHHPYTEGDPSHHASHPENVSVPDLWKMRVLLQAAERSGTLRGSGPVRLWVTEFAWDTSPPDPKGVPERLHARWTAEAMYRMWEQGVSLVTWFLLRDQVDTQFQSGLYFRGAAGLASDRPKLAVRAFRFPFVAFRSERTGVVRFWGKSPRREGVVLVQHGSKNWRTVARVRANRHGIFTGSFRTASARGLARAQLLPSKETALPFSLVAPPDRPGCVWGTC